MANVAVIGASGFVGSACVGALQKGGHEVLAIACPHFSSDQRNIAGLLAKARDHSLRDHIRDQLNGIDVLVNAAGVAAAGSGETDELYGANALLPGVAALAAADAGVHRVVHVSSAAVQGHQRVLREDSVYAPFSPYSHSKSLGEAVAVAARGVGGTVLYRPTSVHGVNRSVTRNVAKLARSPLSSVAGQGQSPTPQVHILNVAAGLAFCVDPMRQPPLVVLQPSEGFTCAGFLTVLGLGRQPKRLPTRGARAIIASARRVSSLRATARRLEMLWFGQLQETSWLTASDWRPEAGLMQWHELAESVAQDGEDARAKD